MPKNLNHILDEGLAKEVSRLIRDPKARKEAAMGAVKAVPGAVIKGALYKMNMEDPLMDAHVDSMIHHFADHWNVTKGHARKVVHNILSRKLAN